MLPLETACLLNWSMLIIFFSQNFLLLGEHEPRMIESVPSHGRGHVSLDNVTAQWSLQNTDLTLNAVSIYVKPKQLVCVIGAIGAGKVSFSSIYIIFVI